MSSPPTPHVRAVGPTQAWPGSSSAAIADAAAADASAGRAARTGSGLLRSRWVHRSARKVAHAPAVELETCFTPGHDGDFPAVAQCLFERMGRATCGTCGGRVHLEDY